MSVGSYQKQSASAGLITLQANPRQVKNFSEFGELLPKAIKAAERRAINKTVRWLRTHIARSVSKQERIAASTVTR